MLEHLYDLRRRALHGLADEQVHVLWHDHVSDEQEGITLSDFRKNLHEQVSCARRLQQRPPLKTTERDEVQIFSAVVALQLAFHAGKEWRTF